MSLELEKALRRDSQDVEISEEIIKRCRARGRAILTDLKKNNAKAHGLAVDTAPFSAGLCARRAGKTYTAVATALATGEAKPGAISIIISLNLKQLRRLYWDGGPSGIWALARKFKLNLKYHNTYLTWTHENGSTGMLLGANDDDELEVIRGLEADVYIIDECKSFPAERLRTLLVDIIAPQRASRRGRVILIGTPGHIFGGPFYEATCRESVHTETKRPFCVTAGETDAWGRTALKDRLWSLHEWSLQDNSSQPWLWDEALATKALYEWADDAPSWLREYLGKWASGADGLVFRWALEIGNGRVTWFPKSTDDNPTGLPEEGAPWRLIGGLDFGFEAPTAFVLAAYSTRLRQLRHVFDFSKAHMLVDDVADALKQVQEIYGPIEKIFCDAGNLGKMIVHTLAVKHGLPVEKADKREKKDYIELVNSAFARGEIQIVDNTVLSHQLRTVAWKFDSDIAGIKDKLARKGRLKEDDSIPNDSTDAFLYMYRGSLHHFGSVEKSNEPIEGTPEWFRAWEKKQLAAARKSFTDSPKARLGTNDFRRAPGPIQRALTRGQWKESIPHN